MQKGSGRYSRPIVRIAILGIILGVAVMIISASIVRGFRTEIRDKVVGFNAHLEVTHYASGQGANEQRLRVDEAFVPELQAIDGLKELRAFTSRSCLVESDEGVEGAICKGLSSTDSSAFINSRIVEGEGLSNSEKVQQEVLISSITARVLDLEVEDKVSLYFRKGQDDFSVRRMRVKGIYKTDLEEFDKQYIFVDNRHIQRVNNWGLSAQVLVMDSCDERGHLIEARAFGGREPHTLSWSNNYYGEGPYYYCPTAPGVLSIILSDDHGTLPDTAFVQFSKSELSACECPYAVDSTWTSGGSNSQYVGGFELFLDDFSELKSTRIKVSEITGPDYQCQDIIERTPEIFSWLEILDVNIYIIITLMIGVAIFNMSSALLIIIIERSNMIGILKALGSADWSVRKIFVYHAGRLILSGLVWGNLLGIGLALMQQQLDLVQLEPETYYLSTVPIELYWLDILLIDVGTLAICLLAMMIPSYFITRITPVKAIRFD